MLRFLDGYPFPLELAAKYMVRTQCGLRLLRERLEANPMGTMRYPGDDVDRTTSLAATLDLSYLELLPIAQQALPLLALFPAGLTRAPARAILGDTSITAPGLFSASSNCWARGRGSACKQRYCCVILRW